MMAIRQAAAIVIALIVITSCGGGTTRQDTLRASLISANSARDAFVVWDQEHKDQIVERAKTFEEGAAELTIYIEKRQKVLLSFELTYRAIAVAALDLDNGTLSAVIIHLKAMYDAIAELTGKKLE